MDKPQELDILEMPFEGLAAYWLSIKKILDAKKGRGIIDEEIAHTEEPYILHLLETAYSPLDKELIRRLAGVKKETLLDDYRRKMDLMRMSVLAIASGENPRVTMVRMDSQFALPPLTEDKAFEMATAMFEAIRPKGVNLTTLLSVNHKIPSDRLLVKLLFFVMLARRGSKQDLERFMPYFGSHLYAEGIAMAIDNFEPDFLDTHMQSVRDNMLKETARKMDMALEMALGIRTKLAYDDLFRIARAYMPQ